MEEVSFIVNIFRGNPGDFKMHINIFKSPRYLISKKFLFSFLNPWAIFY